MSLDGEIAAYYARGEERHRFDGPGRLEFVRTQELLARHLPPPPGRVLDAGGGPGAYATWLTELGYEVHLVDPIALHVDEARGACPGLAGAIVGDARDLPFADTEFDAAAAISRFASTVDGLARGHFADLRFETVVEHALRDGRHSNPGRHPGWFTTAYFHLPAELEEEVSAAGYALIGLLAVEGPGEVVRDLDTWLDDPVTRATLLRAIARVEAEPTMIGSSPHMLALARRV